MSFENYFARLNAYGFHPSVLGKLLRREVFGDLVQDTIAQIRHIYEGYSDLESQRAWCFELYHGQRFFIGGTAWKLSFGAWPIYPGSDREILETAAGIPAAALAERRAQNALVCQRFPHLAMLPLDRGSTYDTTPLLPGARWFVDHALREHLLRWVFQRHGGVEQRFYYRTYDLNGPGWVAIRHRAEPHRKNVSHLFDANVLAELLPPADAPVRLDHPIIGAAGTKSLLGFLLWAKNHL